MAAKLSSQQLHRRSCFSPRFWPRCLSGLVKHAAKPSCLEATTTASKSWLKKESMEIRTSTGIDLNGSRR